MAQNICTKDHLLHGCQNDLCLSLCKSQHGSGSLGVCKSDNFCHCYYECTPSPDNSPYPSLVINRKL